MFEMWWLGGMMKMLTQEINECKLPTYMEDILTNNYCPSFLDMTMVRENENYVFNYRTGRYSRLDINKLNTYLKLVLLKSIIQVKEKNDNWLIKAENYLIEPELIYSINNNVEEGNIRILFYPDFRKLPFNQKIMLFADKIKNKKDRNEIDLIEKFKEFAKTNDWNRTKIFLDKNILRIETGWH